MRRVLEVCPAPRAECIHVAVTFPCIAVPVRGGHRGRRAAEATRHADRFHVCAVQMVMLVSLSVQISSLSVVVILVRPVAPLTVVVILVRPVAPLTVVAIYIRPVVPWIVVVMEVRSVNGRPR